jgi:two-component system NarL family sensor kinase
VVNSAATAQAINDAEVITQIDGRGIVAPLLTPALLAGDPEAISRLNSVVVGRVLSSRAVRVKVWTAAGTVVYSDARRLIGETFNLGDEEQAALEDGSTDSEMSDLSRPENRFERSFGSLVEVYLPVRAVDGTKLLFETYQRDSAIQADQQRIWSGIFPALVAGLALLFIVQIPLSWRLARRLQRSSRDRAALLQRAIDSSETERWRIAGDLHDGPVQNLTAVSLTLGSAAMRLSDPQRQAPTRDELVSVMESASAESRTAIRELRTMIMEIAPPDLDGVVSTARWRGSSRWLRSTASPRSSRPAPPPRATRSMTSPSSIAPRRRAFATSSSMPAPPGWSSACSANRAGSPSRLSMTAADSPPTI